MTRGIPELLLTRGSDSRSFYFTLKDEDGADRDLDGQRVRVVLSDPFTRETFFNGLATIITENPAYVKITPDDDEIPVEGFYNVLVRIEEVTGETITYSEDYKLFNGYVQGSPVLV